jgi:hypothetical protein
MFQHIRENVDLRIISPFIAEGPTPAPMFFGRETEIRRLTEQAHQQSFALVGGRKAGKTSILRRLETQLTHRNPVLYIDCQAHPDRQAFLAYLARLQGRQPEPAAAGAPTETEYFLRSFLNERFYGQFGILLLDEVDELFSSDADAAFHPHVLSRALRSLSQSGAASIIVTGERNLFELTANPFSPHWNFCTPLLIGPLSAEAAKRLLVEPLDALGVRLAPGALEEAISSTARQPNLLQFLGTLLVDSLGEASRTGATLTVPVSQIKALTDSPAFRNRFVLTFWSQARLLEKLITLDLSATQPKTPDAILTSLATSAIRVSASDIRSALRFLELYSIAHEDTDGFRYPATAFDRYFGPMRNSAVVAQWQNDLRSIEA